MPRVSVRAGAATICCTLAILSHDVQAVEVRQVTHPLVVDYHSFSGYNTPVWSPDGQSLVLAAPAIWDPTPGDFPPTYEVVAILARFDLDGNLEDWLASSWGFSRPSPNPTHTQFALWCHVNLTCVDVCIVNTEANPGDEFIACLEGRNPAWSPDGLTIVTEACNGLQMFLSSGGMGIPLTTRSDDRTPAWSPDGTQVVFSSTQGGTRDLWIQTVATGETRRLTNDAATDDWPAWSSNGWIAFASDRDGAKRIWVIPAAGGNALRVSDLALAAAPAWSPNGEALAFESAAHIWVATGLPDFLVSVEPRTWSHVKTLYRDGR